MRDAVAWEPQWMHRCGRPSRKIITNRKINKFSNSLAEDEVCLIIQVLFFFL